VLNSNKPLASLSLDLDNRWSYLKTHGDAGWQSFPTYLPTLLPRLLEFLDQRELKITFFVVGQDAVMEENRAGLRSIADDGHEIGNHSFNHEPWLHLYSEAQLEAELADAEKALLDATGQRPVGFRGPGFSYSSTTLGVLARRGYEYDASTLPTFLGPLARAYYFMTAKLSPEEKTQRAALFGQFKEGFRSVKPYWWRTDGGPLLEIPVTTLPIFKTPIHVSYLLYLGSFSTVAAEAYFRLALTLCRLTGTQPSLLLHPLDFLGKEDAPDLAFFPAMHLPAEVKLDRVGRFVDMLAGQFEIVTMRQHAASIIERAAVSTGVPQRLLAGLEP
jgi:peptidoglycan/xylan/chitin deacetylase (PgdA/CDA1 family)